MISERKPPLPQPERTNPPLVLFTGRATLDVVYSIDHYPSEDTKIFARAMHVAPGGPATNAAITHALLGGRATLITALGGGTWTAPVREDLVRLGIELIDLAKGTSYETPLTTVLASDAHATRTIVNPPQSAVLLNQPEVWNPGCGEAPDLALTDGFHLGETLPFLRAIHAGGVPICLDGGSWKAGTDDLITLLSVAICSERFRVPALQSEPDATIAWFVEKGVSHIAVTRGSKPIVAWDRGRRFEIEIEPVDAVDTTAAGDVLHGAFCYHFAQSREFEPSLRFGARIATRSCRGLGIRGWTQDYPGG